MSATAMTQPSSFFYAESEGTDRISFEQVSPMPSSSKTRQLAEAVGRDLAGPAPSFRPPSGWSVDTRNADVVWHGEGSRQETFHEDQFSDAESWDADQVEEMETSSVMHDDGRSTFGHVRTSSVGSSIFAGRGAKSDRRRREVPPPLPLMPAGEHLITLEKQAGSPSFVLVSPAKTDFSAYESAGDHSLARPIHDPFDAPADVARPLDSWQMPRRAGLPAASGEDLIPSRDSSRSNRSTGRRSGAGKVVEERGSDEPGGSIRASQSFIDTDDSPCASQSSTSIEAEPSCEAEEVRRLPDGTLFPKMPPIPTADDVPRKRSSAKHRNRKDRSLTMASPEDEGEEEELRLMEEIDDAKRMSTLGPKLKKNSPAPWELGGVEEEEPPRPSLREALRGPSHEATDKSFSRFRTRPSVEGQAGPARSNGPLPASALGRQGAMASIHDGVAATGSGTGGSAAASVADEGGSAGGGGPQPGTLLSASQRSRSKSVSSSTASGVLKGLGLATSAGPASKKSKLVKALRLGRDDNRPSPSDLMPDPTTASAPVSAPPLVQESSHSTSCNHPPPLSARSIGYKKSLQETPMSPVSPTTRTSAGVAANKFSPDLAEMILSSNAKYQNQTYSPTSSPSLGARKPLSPRMGGGLALPYKRSPNFSHSTSSESELRVIPSKDSQITISQASLPASMSQMAADTENLRPASQSTLPHAETERAGSGESSRASTRSDSATPTGKFPGSLSSGKFPGLPEGPLPSSGSISAKNNGAAGLPMPGFHHGVQYKLISLEQAREQMKNSHDRLAPSTSMRDHHALASPNLGVEGGSSIVHSPSAQSLHSSIDERQHRSRVASEPGTSQRAVKNKKSGLFRKLKKDKGSVSEMDGPNMPSSTSSRAIDGGSSGTVVGLMPSFSVTGSEAEGGGAITNMNDQMEAPALSLRPVSSMFSGLGANFLESTFADATNATAPSSASGGGGGGGLNANSSGLLAPYSPALTSYSQEDSNRSSTGTNFEDAQERLRTPIQASPVSIMSRPNVAPISPTPHSFSVPGPAVPGSAGSYASGKLSNSSADRMPSLEAEGNTSEGHSRFHSPATSPVTPSFHAVHHQLHGKRGPLEEFGAAPPRERKEATQTSIQSLTELRPETWTDHRSSEAMPSLVVPGNAGAGSPKLGGGVSEEVRKRAIELETQIKQLAIELHQLRETHLPDLSAASFKMLSAADAGGNATLAEDGIVSTPIQSCPSCGCGCAEQRRLQSLNEAAVLKGVGVLDRGRALKPSPNMGNTGKFGGYTNR